MANVNQSAVSPMSLSSFETRKTTWHRIVLLIAAWFEIIVGASFFLAFNAQSQFLFGTTPEGVVGVTFARFAGIALICLGLACIPSGTERSAVRILLVFNIAVAIFFASVAVTTTFRGVLLWPVVTMHAVIAIALALSLNSARRQASEKFS